jgi:tetratricopeptide (TPR) repeat protein
MAERVARRLEELRASLATAAPALVAEVAPVQVIVFKEKGLARAYAPDGAGGDGAGFFLGGPDRRRLFFRDDKDRVPSVSQHEYTHALLDAALPDAPLWLNEGLAEYFSTFRLDPERPRAGSALLDHVQALHDYRLMPLSDLFAVKRTSPAYHEMDRGSVYYAQTWALVHMLLHETGKDPGPKRLERVIVAARDGEKFEVAFHREYGDEKALLLRLQAYVDQERFVERAWPGMTNRYPEDGLAPNDVPTADMMATLGISLLARLEPQTAEAERHLHEALERDERHAEACAGMGWLEVMRQHRAESRAYFERSFAADSVSAPSVRLMASQLILDARQQRASSERDEQVRFARRMLQSALTHSPDDPELQALAARTWVAMPGNDPETGYKLGVRAFAALPGRSDVQLDLVALSALTGRDADAKRLAERFLKPDAPPHHRRTARLALLAGDVRTANQLVQKGNAAAAQAAIQAARQRVADDPELLAETDRLIAHFQGALAMQNETRDENVAVAEYNAGVKAANAEHFAEAAAAFRRAAEKTTRETFRTESLRKARRMDARGQTEKATVLAKAGDKKAAKTILETVDRDVLTEEELRWVDETLGQLRK